MADEYGIKVSKPGFDVKTTADKNLVMGSHLNTLKTAGSGDLAAGNTVAHGLGYVPIYFSINQVTGNFARYTGIWGSQAVGCDDTNLENEGIDEICYYFFYQESR